MATLLLYKPTNKVYTWSNSLGGKTGTGMTWMLMVTISLRNTMDRGIWRNKKEENAGLTGPVKTTKKRRTIHLRIGEAKKPGPQLNTQARQRKLGDFFVKNQRHIDSKSEWCKSKGYTIHNIKGDGNCLYTCL
eukprot:16440183-Heterocapsa_arctica.AAC.1